MARPGSVSDEDLTARLRAAGCVFAEDEARLLREEARDDRHLEAMVRRRVAGQPLEHVLGWAGFCGLRVAVDPGVFVPRRRTELLVREAGPLLGSEGGPVVVVDLCCGTGAVGMAVATGIPEVELHAVDLDPVAVRCATRNVHGLGHVHQGDLFTPLPGRLRGRVDLVVANAPYVPSDEIALMPPEARDHEPPVALDGGEDGLEVQRRLIAEAPRWLRPGGHLLVETSRRQAAGTKEAARHAGLRPRLVRSEELDATVLVASRPGPADPR